MTTDESSDEEEIEEAGNESGNEEEGDAGEDSKTKVKLDRYIYRKPFDDRKKYIYLI